MSKELKYNPRVILTINDTRIAILLDKATEILRMLDDDWDVELLNSWNDCLAGHYVNGGEEFRQANLKVSISRLDFAPEIPPKTDSNSY